MNKLPVLILFSAIMLGMPSVYDEAFADHPQNPIDVVFIIDNSASMGQEIADVKANIVQMNDDLEAGHADARYGLVRIGGPNPGGHFLTDISTFTVFNMAGGPFQLLVATAGNPESGSVGVNVAFSNMNFRGGNVPICIVLLTDEDDDSSAVAFAAAVANLAANPSAVFTLVGVPGVGNTDARYGVLASNSGGDVFTIASFQNDPAAVLAAISDKIIEQAENVAVGGEIIPINTSALLLAGVQSVSMWMIPVVIAGAGIGVFVIMRSRK